MRVLEEAASAAHRWKCHSVHFNYIHTSSILWSVMDISRPFYLMGRFYMTYEIRNLHKISVNPEQMIVSSVPTQHGIDLTQSRDLTKFSVF